MNYKIEGAIRRNRKSFIICAILWLLLVIVFVAPFSYSVFQATNEIGKISLETLMEQLPTNITNPFGTLAGIFTQGATHKFISLLLGFTVLYLVVFFIGFAKSAPKNRYTDIEHGSSDWSQRGEQYQVLSRNKGIILAEDNYLPLDKRGNVNVLVVGRFRFW